MGKTKRVAGTDEPVVGVEVVVEPIEVQVPTLAIPVEVRHVAVAIRVHPDRNAQNIIYTTAPWSLKTISGLYLIRYLNMP